MAGMLIQSLIFSEGCLSITPNLEIGDKVLVSWSVNGLKYSFEAFIDQINKTEFGTSFIFNKVKKDGTPSSVRRHSPAEEYTVVKIPKSNN